MGWMEGEWDGWRMDGWMDGWMGWMGWMGGWIDGMGGWMDERIGEFGWIKVGMRESFTM